MKIIKAKAEILYPDLNSQESVAAVYRNIELAGRTCYKSEAKITPESGLKFVSNIVKNHHEAMLEHAFMAVRFTVDRGVSHEIVRHRLASFAQESTRYCNYSKDKFGNEITVIEPCFFNDIQDEIKEKFKNSPAPFDKIDKEKITDKVNQYAEWNIACRTAEFTYFKMLEFGATPQEARAVLPNSLKTELVMTANMREWRHFFKLRAAGETGKPHPQMLEVAVPLLEQCQRAMPELFGDIKLNNE